MTCLAVTGIDTGIGKTWAVGLLADLIVAQRRA